MKRTSRRSDGAGLAIVLGLLLLPFTTVIYGATLAKLWEWFIIDTFGVFALSTAQAIGVTMVVTFVTYQYDARKADEDTDPLSGLMTALFASVMRAGLALVFGAIVKAFL